MARRRPHARVCGAMALVRAGRAGPPVVTEITLLRAWRIVRIPDCMWACRHYVLRPELCHASATSASDWGCLASARPCRSHVTVAGIARRSRPETFRSPHSDRPARCSAGTPSLVRAGSGRPQVALARFCWWAPTMARTLMAVHSIDLALTRAMSFHSDRRPPAALCGLNPPRFTATLSNASRTACRGCGWDGPCRLSAHIPSRGREGVDLRFHACLDLPSPYFQALGFRLRAGRVFNDHGRSDAETVVIVNRRSRARRGHDRCGGRLIRGERIRDGMTIARRATFSNDDRASSPRSVSVPYLTPRSRRPRTMS